MHFKKIAALTAAASILCSAAGFRVSAEEDIITVKVNNSAVEFDQQPVLINDRTMVPIRAVFEKAGAAVGWDQPTQTATIAKGTVIVTLKYGDTAMYKNGERIELDAPAAMINDRILIPVRAIAEALDFSVSWDGLHSLVLVSTNGKPYRPFAFLKTGFRTLEDSAEFYSMGSDTGSVDLDGDGVAESVSFNGIGDINTITTPVLSINGVDYTSTLGSLSSVYSMAVTDLDTRDNTKEIVITENGDVKTAYFYHYSQGILTPLSNESGVSTVVYADKLLISGMGYLLSDLTGVCFTDIMVSGGIYVYENNSVVLKVMQSIDKVFGRNLYKTYDDNMIYHIIYTDTYERGAYKGIENTGVITSTDITSFKVLDGYFDKDNATYIELYIELPDGTKAVIKPYIT